MIKKNHRNYSTSIDFGSLGFNKTAKENFKSIDAELNNYLDANVIMEPTSPEESRLPEINRNA